MYKNIRKLYKKIISNLLISAIGRCHIEGIDSLNSNFNSIVASVKKKRYDILDHRHVRFFELVASC